MPRHVHIRPIGDYDHIRVEPLTGAIGAEVTGVDLADLDDDAWKELYDAWLCWKVLFFRDQDALTPADHVAFGRRFGDLEVHPFLPHLPDHPEVIVFESSPERFEAAESWHTDVTFRACPSTGSALLGVQVPPYGGDTLWADMELAYETLPDEVKDQIEGRNARHSISRTFAPRMAPDKREEALAEYPDQLHPIVRTHPETGRRAIYVNRNFTIDIPDMAPDEGRALLERLYRQATVPQFQCRFRWRPASLALWDNRCTQHYAVPDYLGESRRMHRVTPAGERPL
jgi:taurine dioxygenase